VPRILLTLLVAVPTLWLTIQVFGSIVSGDLALAGLRVNRDKSGVAFWIWVVVLGTICCALLVLAIGILLNFV
jgi:hypothetical protein